MSRKPKTPRKAKEGGPRRGRSIDAILLRLGRVDIAKELRTAYGARLGVAALLLARREVADLADRLDRVLGDVLTRIEQHATEPPRPRPAS
jgi:hypothetical protein